MSVFNDEDVASLASEGNVAFNAKYMAHYNTHDALPNGSDPAKQKEFIRAKYLDRKWHSDGSGSSGGAGRSNRKSVSRVLCDSVQISLDFGLMWRLNRCMKATPTLQRLKKRSEGFKLNRVLR
jgi:hypothetical protein